MALMIQVEVFWIMMPCNVVVGYQRFRDPYCILLQGILPQNYMASQPRGPQLATCHLFCRHLCSHYNVP
jgi:hypothetical protein